MTTKTKDKLSVKKEVPETSKRVREITGIIKLKKGFDRKKDYADYLIGKYK